VTLTANAASDDHWTCDIVLRNLPPHPPFVVRWQYPLFEIEDDVTKSNPEDLKQPRKPGRPSKYHTGMVKQAIDDNGGDDLEHQDLMKQLVSTWGMSKPTATALIAEALGNGIVVHKTRKDGKKTIRLLGI
jgi:hypothetical protein